MNAPTKPAVLITGAARRIGRAIALDLAQAGWCVAVHYRRSASEAEALVAHIHGLGGSAIAVAADLSSAADTGSLIRRATGLAGRPLTALINNASEFQFDTALGMTEETWDLHVDSNLRAPVFLARDFARALPADRAGTIINIIDQRVLRPTPQFFSYSVAKAALWDATRMLAQALAPRVRVNAIGPGPALRSVHQTEADFASECASTLLQRGTSPDEICAAVRFILDAPAMTGQMIALDGGQHLTWNAELAPASRAGAGE